FESNLLFDFTNDGGSTELVGPFSGVAGAVDDGIYVNALHPVPAPDVLQSFTAGGVDYTVGINWVDADSFDFFLNAFGATDLQNLSLTLSGLDFTSAGQPRNIIGATFNRTASILDEVNPGGPP